MDHPPAPCAQHECRLNQVIDFIDAHLGQDLSLDRLAAHAHFSRYHFLRLFHEWNKEAPHAYVRRRRLEMGASRLLHSSESITRVAGECGFDTADGFSRAFRQYFGVAPLAWRAQRHAARAEPAASAPPVPGRNWPIRIARLPPVRVAYTRQVGPYGLASAEQWRQLAVWMAEQGLPRLTRFGMGLDDPSVTPAAKCRYDVCIELPDDFVAPRRTPVKTIAGGLYAILRYDGPPTQSNAAWQQLLREGAQGGRYRIATRPGFERYACTLPDPGADAQDCELCLPLASEATL